METHAAQSAARRVLSLTDPEALDNMSLADLEQQLRYAERSSATALRSISTLETGADDKVMARTEWSSRGDSSLRTAGAEVVAAGGANGSGTAPKSMAGGRGTDQAADGARSPGRDPRSARGRGPAPRDGTGSGVRGGLDLPSWDHPPTSSQTDHGRASDATVTEAAASALSSEHGPGFGSAAPRAQPTSALLDPLEAELAALVAEAGEEVPYKTLSGADVDLTGPPRGSARGKQGAKRRTAGGRKPSPQRQRLARAYGVKATAYRPPRRIGDGVSRVNRKRLERLARPKGVPAVKHVGGSKPRAGPTATPQAASEAAGARAAPRRLPRADSAAAPRAGRARASPRRGRSLGPTRTRLARGARGRRSKAGGGPSSREPPRGAWLHAAPSVPGFTMGLRPRRRTPETFDSPSRPSSPPSAPVRSPAEVRALLTARSAASISPGQSRGRSTDPSPHAPVGSLRGRSLLSVDDVMRRVGSISPTPQRYGPGRTGKPRVARTAKQSAQRLTKRSTSRRPHPVAHDRTGARDGGAGGGARMSPRRPGASGPAAEQAGSPRTGGGGMRRVGGGGGATTGADARGGGRGAVSPRAGRAAGARRQGAGRDWPPAGNMLPGGRRHGTMGVDRSSAGVGPGMDGGRVAAGRRGPHDDDGVVSDGSESRGGRQQGGGSEGGSGGLRGDGAGRRVRPRRPDGDVSAGSGQASSASARRLLLVRDAGSQTARSPAADSAWAGGADGAELGREQSGFHVSPGFGSQARSGAMADESEATSFSDEDMEGGAGSVGPLDSASGSPRSYGEGGSPAAGGRNGQGQEGSWHRHDLGPVDARGGAAGSGSGGGDGASVGWEEHGGQGAAHGGDNSSYASSSNGSPPVGSGGKQLARGRSHLTMAVSVGQGLIRGASILPAGKPSVAQRSAGHFGSGVDLHAAVRAEKAQSSPLSRPAAIPETSPQSAQRPLVPAAEPAGGGNHSSPGQQARADAVQPDQSHGGAGAVQSAVAASPLPAAGIEQGPADEGAAHGSNGSVAGDAVSDCDIKSEGSAADYDDDFEDAEAEAASKAAPAQAGSLPPLGRAPSGPQVGMGGLSARGGDSTARTQASEPDWY